MIPRKTTADMNNPFKPVPQRRHRIDETWERQQDPTAYAVFEQETSR